MRKIFIYAMGILTLFLSGCGIQNPTPSATDTTGLYETEWRLVSLNGQSIDGKRSPTLEIDEDGRFGGFGGCNEYFGRAKISGHSIHFGVIGSTRRYCIEGHALEHSYFESLEGPKHWRIKSSGKLLLYDDVNRLVFIPKK
jgi:heat shock protein HslJ